MSFHVKQTAAFFESKQYPLEFTFAKTATGQTTIYDKLPNFVSEGGKWNDVEIKKWKDEDGTFKVEAYINELKVLDGKAVEDCPVFNNVSVTTGYKREGGDFAFAVDGQIRNFFVYNKYE